VPSSRLITKPFVAVTVVTAAFFVYVGMLVPILPTFIENELGAGELGVGLSIAVFALTAVAARPWIARLIERFGRRKVIQAGALLAAGAGFATVLADSLVVLLVLRGVAGVGEAALFVAAATLVADLAPPERRAEAASYFSVAVFGGLGIGPILGELVVGDDRYHAAFGIAAAFAALAAVLALWVPTQVQLGDRDGASPEAHAIDRRRALLHPAALGPGAVLAAGIGAFAVFSAFVPEHSREVGLPGSGGLFAAYSVVCLVLRLTGARLPERLGPRRSVTIALCSTASSLTLLAAVPQAWALWASAMLIGVGQAFLYPSLMALTVNRASERERAVALGSFTMFFDVGTVAGGLALGAVAETLGKRSAFAGGVVLAALGLWLLWTRVTTTAAPDHPLAAGVDPAAVHFTAVAGD
jgi:MFS family permease